MSDSAVYVMVSHESCGSANQKFLKNHKTDLGWLGGEGVLRGSGYLESFKNHTRISFLDVPGSYDQWLESGLFHPKEYPIYK